jgi:translation initiation factor IF-2
MRRTTTKHNWILSQQRMNIMRLLGTAGSRRYLHQRANQIKTERLPLPAFIRVRDLAKKIKQPVDQVVKKVAYKKNRKYHMQFGQDYYEFKNVKQIILPFQLAKKIVAKYYDIEVKYEPLEPEFTSSSTTKSGKTITMKNPKERNAVIAVMGHVDHGKTTIMDRLSTTNIASREVEKITQKINVTEAKLSLDEDEDVDHSQSVTFLDTPGHFHFFRMRNNAAQVADVVLLVVAADEGVQLQTQESIGCIEENQLPVITCINKIDLLKSNGQKQIQQIIQEIRSFVALQACPIIPISAIDSTKNLNQLRKSIIHFLCLPSMKHHLEAEFDPNTKAEGIVLESIKQKGKGSVLRVLIKHGILKRQDSFVCGMIHGTIKSIQNCHGKELKEAVPGTVVDLLYNNKSKYIDAPIEFGFFVMKPDQAKQVIEQRELAMDFEESMVPSPEEIKAIEQKERLEKEKEKEDSIDDEEQDDVDNDKELKEYTEVNEIKKTIIVKADGAGSLTSIQDTVDEMDHVTVSSFSILVPKVNLVYSYNTIDCSSWDW